MQASPEDFGTFLHRSLHLALTIGLELLTFLGWAASNASVAQEQWSRCVVRKGLAACVLVLSLLPVAASPQTAQPLPLSTIGRPSDATSREGLGGYYVEFRVALIGTYGHSYAVYGPRKGRPNYADLHPMGGYLGMAVGHVVPVAANTEWNPEVASLPVAARYRRNLSAEQYQKLITKVRELRAKPGYWNAVSNNCNHFIGELAQAVGLRVPATFQVSYSFVPALRALNEAEKPEERTGKPRRPAQAPSS